MYIYIYIYIYTYSTVCYSVVLWHSIAHFRGARPCYTILYYSILYSVLFRVYYTLL